MPFLRLHLLTALLLVCAGRLAAEEPAAPPFEFTELTPGPTDTEVRKLQVEKYNTLLQASDIGRKLYMSKRLDAEGGSAGLTADLRALVDYRLFLVANPAERVRVIEAGVARLRQMEEVAIALRNAGRTTELPAARFKVARLDLEIRLAQTKKAFPAAK